MERTAEGRFAKGRIMTPEEKLKASRALSEAAKRKPGYIGDIKEKHPRVFNSWRAIMYTEKGKNAGVCEEWKHYRNFYNDVISGYRKGLVLRRKDINRIWSKDNYVWVTMEEAGAMRTATFLTYNGETHSLKEWSEIANCSFAAINVRYARREKKGYSTEEIIYGRKTSRGSKIAKSIEDSACTIRAKASKMISSYRARDIKNGYLPCNITIEWMIANILRKPCIYCGDTARVGCDRIDNNKGHTKDNVVPCCIECNSARNSFFSFKEMKELGKAIAAIKAARNKIVK